MFLLFLAFQLFVGVVICDDAPIVNTSLGLIQGTYDATYNDRTFATYLGIPYAQPPIGVLRFEDPVPVEPWDDTLIANESIVCRQVRHAAIPAGGRSLGVEDCLYLNVYVPEHNQTGLLDVLVYIHGGGFTYGSGLVGARFMMDRDVIVVGFNYRLGVLGFLSTDDEVLPGNVGMKDQVLALEWIRDHISSFGGNPNSVTISGLSGGAAGVHFHYLSPLSAGLFHKGISKSGVALVPWAFQEKPLENALWIGNQVGCNDTDTADLVDCLKTVDVDDLVETIRTLRPWLYNPLNPLGLVVEKCGSNKFLPEHPYVLLANGSVNDVPWMISTMAEEGFYPGAEFRMDQTYFDDLDGDWLDLAPYVLDYSSTIPQIRMDDVSETIRLEYFGNETISNDTFPQLIDVLTDRLFGIHIEEAVRLHASATTSPVYFYYFSYVREELGGMTGFFTGLEQFEGTSHGDDFVFFWSNAGVTSQALSQRDYDMQEIFLDMWISFASTGVPTIPSVVWTPVSSSSSSPVMQLHIDSPELMFMENAATIERHRTMWDSLDFEENGNL